MRILLVVRSLDVGGAQRQLVALARGLRRRGHEVGVGVFYAGGVFEEELRSEGIVLHDLSKRSRWDVVPAFLSLVRLVRSERPDVVYAFMGLANLFAAVAKPLCPEVPVVWGIRTAVRDVRVYGWASRLGSWLERMTSPLADVIVANSQAARDSAIARGMEDAKIVVVPNGIDCERFRFDREGRERTRYTWGIPNDAPLVGMVARLDPVKGHPTFLRAAAALARSRENVRFVCVGDGTADYRTALLRLVAELGISSRVAWSGESRVTSGIYSALDVAVLSSAEGESFPNVVAEAMACGRRCVVTDTGDVRSIVGETARVVSPGDDVALARAIAEVLDQARVAEAPFSAATRARIEANYSLEMLVSRTEEALYRVRPRALAG